MCYRTDCKEECYEIKKAVCIKRITKEQMGVKKQILGDMVCECGNTKVNARTKGYRVLLCTHCGLISPPPFKNKKAGLDYEQLL